MYEPMPEAFYRLHRDNPREGPGSDDSTREAIRRVRPRLPAKPVVLDIGCGPGRQTVVLTQELDVPVTAVDTHEPFLAQLRQSAAAAGLAERITIRRQSMAELEDAPASVDLIWCEGAIFIVGFGEGLRMWRPLLRAGGILAATELTWLMDDPPGEIAEYFRAAYPPMTTIEGNTATARAAGYEVFDHFVLPSRVWWDEYLTPLDERAAALRPEAKNDPALAAVLDEQAIESDMVRRFGDTFGYVFYLMCRPYGAPVRTIGR